MFECDLSINKSKLKARKKKKSRKTDAESRAPNFTIKNLLQKVIESTFQISKPSSIGKDPVRTSLLYCSQVLCLLNTPRLKKALIRQKSKNSKLTLEKVLGQNRDWKNQTLSTNVSCMDYIFVKLISRKFQKASLTTVNWIDQLI